jgi:hypothetical protein
VRLVFDFLAMRTFERVFGCKAFVDALGKALPQAERQEREELHRLADSQDWEFEEYISECRIVDHTFEQWVHRYAAYANIVILTSTVERQLFACGEGVLRRKKAQPRKLPRTGSLDRAAKFVRSVSEVDLCRDEAWPELLAMEQLRNMIVHNDGAARDESETRWLEKQAATRGPMLTLVPDIQPHPPHMACSLDLPRHFANLVEDFFKRALPALGFADRGVRHLPSED